MQGPLENAEQNTISSTFCTTPIPWLEYLTGVPPVQQKANYMLCNALQRTSHMPINHILNCMASMLVVHSIQGCRYAHQPPHNIWHLKEAVQQHPLLALHDLLTRVGNRLLDCTTWVHINILAAPPQASKVFDQWSEGWMRQCNDDSDDKTIVGSDGLYKIKGQGVSTFVVQQDGVTTHSASQLVLAHSSYDAEMHAANLAIEYITHNVTSSVMFFINNQSTLKSLFSTKPHSAFELSCINCQHVGDWLGWSPNNSIDFWRMPSHLGFKINELADQAADTTIIGPPPFPVHTIASRIWHNHALAISEWRSAWSTFAETKSLKLKKQHKLMLPNAWDGKGKEFISLAGDITTFSHFTRLVSGHMPTGEFRQRFFPHEPRGCTCFHQFQSQSHLLVECPKYSFKFSSMIAFNIANNNMSKIFRFSQREPFGFYLWGQAHRHIEASLDYAFSFFCTPAFLIAVHQDFYSSSNYDTWL